MDKLIESHQPFTHHINDVIKGLEKLNTKFSPTELEQYCFEYACRLLENNHQEPTKYHNKYYETIIIGEYKKALSLATNIYNSGKKPEIIIPYVGLTSDYVKKVGEKK